MSELTSIEKKKLELLFEMGSGYVLDFSNRNFSEFINDILQIDIYADKYDYKTGSKANRLRAFWKIESNHSVAILTKAMLAYWQDNKMLNAQEITQQEQSIYHSCTEILSRLLSDVNNDEEKINKNKIPKSQEMDNQDQSRAAVSREQKTTTSKKLTNHLLIIGIDEYEDKDIPDLNNAVKDAKAFKETLLAQYQFEEVNTTCLFNGEATRRNILSTFEDLLNKLTENDNLVFYYSGHGELVKRGRKERGYWLPATAIAGETSSYLANNDIVDLYADSYAHHIFGIVDSCFSGSLFVGKRGNVEKKLFYHSSRWLLTAGLLEPVSDGSLGENSPFAKTLLYYLRNNQTNSLWVSELCNQVLRGVEDNSKNQTPRGEPLHDVGHYGGQFIFYKKGYTPDTKEVEKIIAGQTKSIPQNTNTPTTPKKVAVTPTPPITTTVKTSFKDLSDLKIHLKSLAEDDLGQALKVYQSSLANDSRKVNDIIGQLGRYNRSNKDFNNSLTTMEQRNREFARIRYALMQMIDDLEQEDIGIEYEATKNVEDKNTKEETGIVEKVVSDKVQLNKRDLQLINLLQDKIHSIKTALILETDASTKFKYKQQIEEAEQQLQEIKNQLG